MNWSTMNTDSDFDHGDRDQHDTVDLAQAQPQQPQSMPLDCDWARTDYAISPSPSTWNAALASQAMPTSNQHFDWSFPYSADPANTMSSVFDNPTPSLSPNYHGNATGYSSQFASISPERQTLDLSSPSIQRNVHDNEVYPRALAARPHAPVQSTRRRGRSTQQLQDTPTSQPMKCEWNGCHYPGTFKRESLLLRHVKTVHVSPGAHPCPVPGCDMVCNRADNLTQHMRNIHR